MARRPGYDHRNIRKNGKYDATATLSIDVNISDSIGRCPDSCSAFSEGSGYAGSKAGT